MSEPADPSRLIAGQYGVEAERPLADGGGGLPAFGAADRRSGAGAFMALQVQPLRPPRAAALAALQANPVAGVLSPLAHGTFPIGGDREGYFIVVPGAPGPSLAARPRAWSETELLDHVLRPAVQALGALHARGVTHRAIRLDNIFQAAPGERVVLGAAWAAPPASLQPALYEPPYAAMCHPACRGEGAPADDVYALGAVLLALALGRIPLADLDEDAIIRRKLEFGSFAALAGTGRLTPIIADLTRGMLAEDPEHRPTAASLSDLATARGRRIAARPVKRAQQSLVIGSVECWDARTLAYAIARQPSEALRSLRSGLLDSWMRRSLGERAILTEFEETLRQHELRANPVGGQAEPALMARLVAVLDPLAPLCFDGLAIWPDGIAPAVAAAQADEELGRKLVRIIGDEMFIAWAMGRPERRDVGRIRYEARQVRQNLQPRGAAADLARLTYVINPLLRCASPLLERRWVARIADLLPALENLAGTADRATTLPLDRAMLAFVAARSETAGLGDTRQFAQMTPAAVVGQLGILAKLQGRFHPAPLGALCGWFAAHVALLSAPIQGRTRRTAFQDELRAVAARGQLADMMAMVERLSQGGADDRQAEQARQALARLDAELGRIGRAGRSRKARARCLGQELAVGAGVAALASVLLLTAWG